MSKKMFQLPLTPFAYRIISTRYGAEVECTYRINKPLWEELQISPLSDWKGSRTALTHYVLIRTSGRLAQKFRTADLEALGMSLHYACLRKMHDFLYAQTMADVSASAALRNFYALHGISEDDYNMDSAYRSWERYNNNLPKKTLKNIKNGNYQLVTDVIQHSNHLHRLERSLRLRSTDIETVIFQYFSIDRSIYVETSQRYAILRPKLLLFYAFRKWTHLSYRQIANKCNCSHTNIIKHVRNFEQRLSSDAELLAAFRELVNQMTASRTAVLTKSRNAA